MMVYAKEKRNNHPAKAKDHSPYQDEVAGCGAAGIEDDEADSPPALSPLKNL